MNVCTSRHRLFIPQENVEHICRFLAGRSADLYSLRLVCKAFHASATSFLLNACCSQPSELFNRDSTDTIPSEVSSRKPITIWTEIEMPKEITLDDRSTTDGTTFLELVHLPDAMPRNRTMAFALGGRKAICWGLLRERQVLVIAHRKSYALAAIRGF